AEMEKHIDVAIVAGRRDAGEAERFAIRYAVIAGAPDGFITVPEPRLPVDQPGRKFPEVRASGQGCISKQRRVERLEGPRATAGADEKDQRSQTNADGYQ